MVVSQFVFSECFRGEQLENEGEATVSAQLTALGIPNFLKIKTSLKKIKHHVIQN